MIVANDQGKEQDTEVNSRRHGEEQHNHRHEACAVIQILHPPHIVLFGRQFLVKQLFESVVVSKLESMKQLAAFFNEIPQESKHLEQCHLAGISVGRWDMFH